ncbi:hypothetical protein [Rossellomorea sp. DUT-2]|uniref:hypothetical protein n=1 Tax=Rossellomorea sp. DUT-2 TaxID=3412021 RepID=UPI003D16CF60
MGKLKDKKKGALAHLRLIRDELEQIVEYTKEDDEIDLRFADLSKQEMKDMYIKRKDYKLASLTLEVYAVLEQLMKGIYKDRTGEEYRTPPVKENEKRKNVVHDIQTKLTEQKILDIHPTLTKRLTVFRNKIAHKDFSFNRTKMDFDSRAISPEKFLEELLDDATQYIKSIKKIK